MPLDEKKAMQAVREELDRIHIQERHEWMARRMMLVAAIILALIVLMLLVWR